MSSPARSRPEAFDLAVVALSARALAASARRAGLKALAIDLFADADTRKHAERAVRADAHRRGPGFDRKSLLAAIEANAPAGLPVVLGAGFEHAPGLMRAIAARNPIRGATPDQVKLLKDPFAFDVLLTKLGIPHPEVSARTSPIPPLDKGRVRVGFVSGCDSSGERGVPRPATPPDPSLRSGPPSPLRGRDSGGALQHSRHARAVANPSELAPLSPSPLRGGVRGGGGSEHGVEGEAAALSQTEAPHPEGPPPLTPPRKGEGNGNDALWRRPRDFACVHDFDVEPCDPRKSWIPGSAGHDDLPCSDDALVGGWISKRAGASGGTHIRRGDAPGRRRYLQRLVEGRAISALFLADGNSTKIIGFSEQWTDPTATAPFRYGGAVGPVDLLSPLVDDIASALDKIVAATGLAGLASADMIVAEGSSFQLLEINPRPGATLDVFDRDETPSLLGLHLAACAGRLLSPNLESGRATRTACFETPSSRTAPQHEDVLRLGSLNSPHAEEPAIRQASRSTHALDPNLDLPAPSTCHAAAIVYAEQPVGNVTLRRPLWTADWPSCDESLPVGAPVCTVLAAAASPPAARALVMERRAELLASLRVDASAPEIINTNATVPA